MFTTSTRAVIKLVNKVMFQSTVMFDSKIRQEGKKTYLISFIFLYSENDIIK